MQFEHTLNKDRFTSPHKTQLSCSQIFIRIDMHGSYRKQYKIVKWVNEINSRTSGTVAAENT